MTRICLYLYQAVSCFIEGIAGYGKTKRSVKEQKSRCNKVKGVVCGLMTDMK